MPLRPSVFFVVAFGVLTLADALTTWWCIHRLGYAETNPLTDTTNLWTLLRPEVIALSIGLAMVVTGSWWIFRRSGWAGADGFAEFRARLFTFRRLPATLLLLLPPCFAIARLLPVFNNLAIIAFGDSGFGQLVDRASTALDLNYFRTYALAHVLLFVILVYPVAFLLHSWTRRGTWKLVN